MVVSPLEITRFGRSDDISLLAVWSTLPHWALSTLEHLWVYWTVVGNGANQRIMFFFHQCGADQICQPVHVWSLKAPEQADKSDLSWGCLSNVFPRWKMNCQTIFSKNILTFWGKKKTYSCSCHKLNKKIDTTPTFVRSCELEENLV